MTKPEIVKRVSVLTGIAQVDVRAVISAYDQTLVEALLTDKRLMTQLGVFSIKERKAGSFRNPKTGGMVDKPAGVRVKFKVNSAMKDELNSGLKRTD